MELEQLIEEINKGDIPSPYHLEDRVDMSGAKELTTIDTDEHRWYIVGTVVYQLGEKFFGVCGPISLKSESMGWDDVGFSCEAFEMEAVPSVTYKKK
jgi:hypothetical protein